MVPFDADPPPAPSGGLDLTSLRDIFQTEARELLAGIQTRLGELSGAPHDEDALAAVAAQGHALKGADPLTGQLLEAQAGRAKKPGLLDELPPLLDSAGGIASIGCVEGVVAIMRKATARLSHVKAVSRLSFSRAAAASTPASDSSAT